MRPVSEALKEILSNFNVSSTEIVPLAESLGRVLARDVRAEGDLPPFDNSSMDGYALRAADVTQTPMRLRVVGDIPAGAAADFTVGEGQAARIMTGAAVPPGADAVIPVEETDHDADNPALPTEIEIRARVGVGASIRRRGEDVTAGEVLLSAGHALRPQDLGLLAGLGHPQVEVIRQPRVAIFSTGDELLPPDAPLTPGKIHDMNSYSLPAMVTSLGAQALYLGIAADTESAVEAILRQALDSGADFILSSAGVSVGTRDVVKAVVSRLGGLDLWKVNMRPGKPLAFGQVAGVPFMGLPGNPVSALTTFEIFARPAILKMLGRPVDVPTVEVIVGEDMPNGDGRESYIRVRLRREGGDLIAHTTGTQSSGAISSLVKADALLIIPAGVTAVKAGERLRVRPFAGQGVGA